MSDQLSDIHRLGLKLKFAYSIVGLLLGLACIITGAVLGLYGVVGHTGWTASLFGFKSNLTDAGPGVIVFIVGIFLVLITRFKVKETVSGTLPAVQPPPLAPQAKQGDPAPAGDTTPQVGGGGGGGGSRFRRGIAYAPHKY